MTSSELHWSGSCNQPTSYRCFVVAQERAKPSFSANWSITCAVRDVKYSSWHRNGTFRVHIEGRAVDGVVDGPAKVLLTATLYGSSDRSPIDSLGMTPSLGRRC